ncbi:hypothetical protein BCACH14_03900 [Bacillus cereus]|nr:hypothetical protein BCACH14_03900 [Bacillus cereus]
MFSINIKYKNHFTSKFHSTIALDYVKIMTNLTFNNVHFFLLNSHQIFSINLITSSL